MKKTKIICTMGPNEDNRQVMIDLAKTAVSWRKKQKKRQKAKTVKQKTKA